MGQTLTLTLPLPEEERKKSQKRQVAAAEIRSSVGAEHARRGVYVHLPLLASLRYANPIWGASNEDTCLRLGHQFN